MSDITLGIIGSGQLGSLLCQAAKKLNIKTVVISDDEHGPAQNYSDQFISENYNNDILSFKGGKGDIIIYDTYGIHRAKKVINSNFVRKSLFFQIDTNLNSAEPSLVNPSFFDKLNQKQSQFFGFGLKNESDTYPITNFKTLPFKISLKYFSN